MLMHLLFFCLGTLAFCAPALAGTNPSSAPELDGGSLAALTTVVTGAYLAYRVYRVKKRS